MTITFSDLGLSPDLVQATDALGYTSPTPIQAQVIPFLVDGHDVVGQAQTGTGKTAAFALPILNKITSSTGQVQALILTPTRELANQVTKSFSEFAKYSKIRVLPVYGGQPYGHQKRSLRRGVDVVVGTPGRLIDLIQQGDLDLSGTHSVALDEADEMLSMGFVEDIETILQSVPDNRQTLLFSATMPGPIRSLANKYMSDAQSVTIKRKALTAENIDQRFYLVNEKDRRAATMRLLESEETTRVIIFGQTRIRTSELAAALTEHGLAAEVLNGDLSQEARERVMRRFRNNKTNILVATDVAARGLDVDGVSHVINFDVPREVESYVHRIGRTGRAGNTGVAISLLTPNERHRISKIERHIKVKIPQTDLPTVEQIQAKRNERLEEQMQTKLRRGRFKAELSIVEELVADGHDPLHVAAAALRLSRAHDEQREIPHVSEVVNRPKKSKSSRHSGRGRRSGGGYKGGYKGKGKSKGKSYARNGRPKKSHR